MRNHSALIIVILFVVFVLPVSAENKGVLFREEFNSLESWKPLHFPKIKKHSIYSIGKDNRGNYLKTESNASASGIILKKEFNVFEYSTVKWRWKISNIYQKGNAKIKSGDDYPIRVYIIFKYDPEKASFGQKLKFGLARKIYGEYPPHSTLNYIWANLEHAERILVNAYANESRMVILQAGSENAGKWIYEEVNILRDYYEAFGEDPPATANIAIMNDSDNTGESAISLLDYIEVYR
jgi:hypothetical protein